MEENRVFDLLCIASEFGLEDLEMTCEDLLCRNLEPRTACGLLASAIHSKKKQRNFGRGLQRIIDRCIAFIGENPTDCLQTPECLSFPSEILVEIISSDQVSSSNARLR